MILARIVVEVILLRRLLLSLRVSLIAASTLERVLILTETSQICLVVKRQLSLWVVDWGAADWLAELTSFKRLFRHECRTLTWLGWYWCLWLLKTTIACLSWWGPIICWWRQFWRLLLISLILNQRLKHVWYVLRIWVHGNCMLKFGRYIWILLPHRGQYLLNHRV